MTDEKTVPLVKRMRLRYAGVCRECGAELAAGAPAYYERASKTVSCSRLHHARHRPAIRAHRGPSRSAGCRASSAGCGARAEPAPASGRPGTPAIGGGGRLRPAGVRASTRQPGTAHPHRAPAARRPHPRRVGRPSEHQGLGRGRERGRGPRKATRRPGEPHRAGPARPTHTPHPSQHRPHRRLSHGGAAWSTPKKYTRPTAPEGGGRASSVPRTEKLMVGSRDGSKLVDGVLKQVDLVRSALADASVEVRGYLCFVAADWPLFGGSFATRGVTALWPKKLAGSHRRTGSAHRGRDPPSARSSGDRVPGRLTRFRRDVLPHPRRRDTGRRDVGGITVLRPTSVLRTSSTEGQGHGIACELGPRQRRAGGESRELRLRRAFRLGW